MDMISASVLDCAVVDCLLAYQHTGVEPMNAMTPLVDL
jgi:hypothetical protein